MNLPQFKYHPNPLKTGAICKSENKCVCCGRKRGYIYCASVYGEQDLDDCLCPWCIAYGKAAEKFDCSFIDDYPLYQAGIEERIIYEISKKTPGYHSWQQECWLTHCQDACEFHGDATREEVREFLSQDYTLFGAEELDESDISQILSYYQPGGNPAIYKFICRHCGQIQYSMDFS